MLKNQKKKIRKEENKKKWLKERKKLLVTASYEPRHTSANWFAAISPTAGRSYLFSQPADGTVLKI